MYHRDISWKYILYIDDIIIEQEKLIIYEIWTLHISIDNYSPILCYIIPIFCIYCMQCWNALFDFNIFNYCFNGILFVWAENYCFCKHEMNMVIIIYLSSNSMRSLVSLQISQSIVRQIIFFNIFIRKCYLDSAYSTNTARVYF